MLATNVEKGEIKWNIQMAKNWLSGKYSGPEICDSCEQEIPNGKTKEQLKEHLEHEAMFYVKNAELVFEHIGEIRVYCRKCNLFEWKDPKLEEWCVKEL